MREGDQGMSIEEKKNYFVGRGRGTKPPTPPLIIHYHFCVYGFLGFSFLRKGI